MNKLNDKILSMSLGVLTDTEFKNKLIKKYKDVEWNQIVEIVREINKLEKLSEEYAIKYRRNEIKKKDIFTELKNKFPNYNKSSFRKVFADSLSATR
jgi:hypothetical protein